VLQIVIPVRLTRQLINCLDTELTLTTATRLKEVFVGWNCKCECIAVTKELSEDVKRIAERKTPRERMSRRRGWAPRGWRRTSRERHWSTIFAIVIIIIPPVFYKCHTNNGTLSKTMVIYFLYYQFQQNYSYTKGAQMFTRVHRVELILWFWLSLDLIIQFSKNQNSSLIWLTELKKPAKCQRLCQWLLSFPLNNNLALTNFFCKG